MRLHNRQIKASFWTDTCLIQHLTREQRMFYVGLWQLADDSGCLFDDPFAFKIQLYPGDMDITPDILREWRDKLVSLEKLIPYESDGRACLYLKRFHRHQTLRSPAGPTVPLPPWIKWIPSKQHRRSGKYEVLEPYGERTVTMTTPHGDQPEPEPEPEVQPEPEVPPLAPPVGEQPAAPCDNDNGNDSEIRDPVADVISFFTNNVVLAPSQFQIENLVAWIEDDGMEPDLIKFAMEQAVLYNKRSPKYIDAILLRYRNEGIKTRKAAEHQEALRQEAKARGDPQGNNSEAMMTGTPIPIDMDELDRLQQQAKELMASGIGDK